MRRISLVPLLALLLACQAFSFEYRSAHFLDRVRNSQETLYSQVVRYYDSLLTIRPSAVVQIEKCKFMESALYDAENEMNPKEEDWDSCYQSLLGRYPLDARVIAYRLSHFYGDSVLVHGESALERARTGILAGADSQTMASIHKSLAFAYSTQDSAHRSLMACFAAQRLDDTIRVELLAAEQWAALGNSAEARKTLLQGEARLQNWELNQAAEILLERGYPKDAERFYRKNLADTTMYTNYVGLAKALERAGEIDSARKYNAVALGKQYNKSQATKRQFEFDLQHSSGGVALESYRAFRDQGIKGDPFSFYRLRLFFLHPFQPIMLRELGGLGLLIMALLALVVTPYLWVLPLHYAGVHWFAKRRPPATARFTFRHFWICNSAVLSIGFLAAGIFQHGLIEDAMGLVSYYGAQDQPSDWENTLYFLSITGLSGLFTAVFCFRTRAAFLFKSEIDPIRAVLYVLGTFAVFYVVRRLNFAAFPELTKETSDEITNGSVMPLLRSSLITMGLVPTLLLVAVLVPLYEEILFRGVFLESVGKYFPFWLVNGLQSLVFAALHGSLRLLPTFFIMGLAFGLLARKTGGLWVPLLAHGANNLLATGTLWWMLRRLGKLP